MVLFAAGIILAGNSPALSASTAKITQYYQNYHAGILVSELLINLASVVLLWFLGRALIQATPTKQSTALVLGRAAWEGSAASPW